MSSQEAQTIQLSEPPEKKELPFRPYEQFFKSVANFHPIYGKFAGQRVTFERQDLDRIPYEWFHYDCWHKASPQSGEIELKKNKIYMVGGIPGGGKSALLANIAAHYPKIIDVFGSFDDECLETLRAYKYLKKWEKCLILGPRSTSLTSSWDYKYYDKFTISDAYNYEAIVLPQKVHPNIDTFYQACQRVVDVLLHRPKVEKGNHWFVMIREAANIVYARQAMKNASGEKAKAYLMWATRQLRHMGLAEGLDSQYLLALEKEMRGIAYYVFLKNLGAFDLPPELKHLFGWFNPSSLSSLYPNEFVCMDRYGSIYTGVFQEPPWHKHEDEDLYEQLGISYDWGDPELARMTIPEQQEDMFLHAEVVRLAADPANLYQGKPAIKRIARLTGHDRETVRRILDKHFEDKSCSCHKTVEAS